MEQRRRPGRPSIEGQIYNVKLPHDLSDALKRYRDEFYGSASDAIRSLITFALSYEIGFLSAEELDPDMSPEQVVSAFADGTIQLAGDGKAIDCSTPGAWRG